MSGTDDTAPNVSSADRRRDLLLLGAAALGLAVSLAGVTIDDPSAAIIGLAGAAGAVGALAVWRRSP
ncbi:MAG TPA: hypothetical protein PKZ97_16755, partial [Azospirillaceae bacterium]|nr:hypothetical protein [Azospirillaceae bacterium]